MDEFWTAGPQSWEVTEPPPAEITNASYQNSLRADFSCQPLKSLHVRNLTCPVDKRIPEIWKRVEEATFSDQVENIKFSGRVSFYHFNNILNRCRNVKSLEFKGVTVEIGDDRELSLENSILGSPKPINMDFLNKITFNISITNQMDVGTKPGFRFIFAFLNNLFCRALETIDIKCTNEQFADLPLFEAFLPRLELEKQSDSMFTPNPLMEFIYKKRYTIKQVRVTASPAGNAKSTSEVVPKQLDFQFKCGRCTGADQVQLESIYTSPSYPLTSHWRGVMIQQRHLISLRVAFNTLETWLAIRQAIRQSASSLKTLSLSTTQSAQSSEENEIPWWNCQCLSHCQNLEELTMHYESLPVYNLSKLPKSIKRLRLNMELTPQAQDEIVKSLPNLEEFSWTLPSQPVQPVEKNSSLMDTETAGGPSDQDDTEGPSVDIANNSILKKLLAKPNLKLVHFRTDRTVKGTGRLRRFCEENSTITSPMMFQLKSDKNPFEVIIRHPNFKAEKNPDSKAQYTPHCLMLRSLFSCSSSNNSTVDPDLVAAAGSSQGSGSAN